MVTIHRRIRVVRAKRFLNSHRRDKLKTKTFVSVRMGHGCPSCVSYHRTPFRHPLGLSPITSGGGGSAQYRASMRSAKVAIARPGANRRDRHSQSTAAIDRGNLQGRTTEATGRGRCGCTIRSQNGRDGGVHALERLCIIHHSNFVTSVEFLAVDAILPYFVREGVPVDDVKVQLEKEVGLVGE